MSLENTDRNTKIVLALLCRPKLQNSKSSYYKFCLNPFVNRFHVNFIYLNVSKKIFFFVFGIV